MCLWDVPSRHPGVVFVLFSWPDIATTAIEYACCTSPPVITLSDLAINTATNPGTSLDGGEGGEATCSVPLGQTTTSTSELSEQKQQTNYWYPSIADIGLELQNENQLTRHPFKNWWSVNVVNNRWLKAVDNNTPSLPQLGGWTFSNQRPVQIICTYMISHLSLERVTRTWPHPRVVAMLVYPSCHRQAEVEQVQIILNREEMMGICKAQKNKKSLSDAAK